MVVDATAVAVADAGVDMIRPNNKFGDCINISWLLDQSMLPIA